MYTTLQRNALQALCLHGVHLGPIMKVRLAVDNMCSTTSHGIRYWQICRLVDYIFSHRLLNTDAFLEIKEYYILFTNTQKLF